MTTSGLLLAAALTFFGTEIEHQTKDTSAPKLLEEHIPAAEPGKEHSPSNHEEASKSNASREAAEPEHAVGTSAHHTTPAEHSPGTDSSRTLSPEKAGHSRVQGNSKKHQASHLPPAPVRPKGVLCGALPPTKTTWKAKQGPLTLVGTVVIGPGAQLVIGAGTEIKIGGFDSCPDSGATESNGRSIAVVVRGGSLHLSGTSDKPIRFTTPATGKGYLWNGIRVEKAARDQDATIRWIELSRATKGVSFLAGAGSLEHSVVEDCGIGIASLLGASPTISHCVIARSAITGVASNRSATRIVSSLILDGGDGIRFDGTGLSTIATSCFWGQTGTPVVRGPAGIGGWKADTTPDRFGNWHRDPIFRESAAHEHKLADARQKLANQQWWKPRRLPENPPGQGRWSLSPFSPLIDKGEGRFCSDLDGSKCDIGLWGGK